MLTKLPIRTKLNIIITTFAIAVSACTMGAFYLSARSALMGKVRERLASLANTAALQINGDVHSSFVSWKDQKHPRYMAMKRVLWYIREANPGVSSIYTLRPGKDHPGVWDYIVDADESPAPIGSRFKICSRREMLAGLSRPSSDEDVTTDICGERIAGYAPIRDARGRSVGLVEVDMPMEKLVEAMSALPSMRRMGIMLTALAAIVSLLLGTVLAAFASRPLRSLVTRLQAAARGDLDTLIDNHRGDEIGEVARTFNEMLISLKSKDEMLRQMNTDYLTGLNNHRFFQQRLQGTLDEANERSKEVALLMLDIDRFKLVNDALGHIVGDNLLRQVADVLVANTSEEYTVARYGGEEFVIIIPGATMDRALEIGENLRAAIASTAFRIPPESRADCGPGAPDTITITVSVGAAAYPYHSKEQDGLIMAADIALYRAKHLGRDRVCAYNAEVNNDGQTDPYHVYTFIKDPTKSTIEALAAAVDARDHYTRNHSENVTRYSGLIGRALQLDLNAMDKLRTASLLHDVGKIGIPDYVLNKPSSLNSEEMEVIRSHPAIGESIVRNSQSLESILPGILYHHEHYNGAGYPFGLSGDAIPLLARIIAVADTYDALTTNRPYRRALSIREAVDVLQTHKGTQFDPEIVDAFLSELHEEILVACGSAA